MRGVEGWGGAGGEGWEGRGRETDRRGVWGRGWGMVEERRGAGGGAQGGACGVQIKGKSTINQYNFVLTTFILNADLFRNIHSFIRVKYILFKKITFIDTGTVCIIPLSHFYFIHIIVNRSL